MKPSDQKGILVAMKWEERDFWKQWIGIVFGALLLSGALARPVAAQAPGGSGAGRSRAAVPKRIDPALRFPVRERDLFRSWYVDEYGRGKCPPGMTKKTTDCVPPGLTDKRYTIGTPLPGPVLITPLPLDLARRIGSPPIGYRYALIDGDLLKLTVENSLVVDAIDGMVP